MLKERFLTEPEVAKLRFCMIDDQTASLQSLSICAQNMGGQSISKASTFAEGIRRLKERTFDVVLCDYMLGGGRTGQQLLEELRRFSLLPDETVFIMVTAEQAYEQVISAVELVPDDYILKPFSGEQLHLRLERAILKKRFFSKVFQLRREKNFEATLAELASLGAKPSNYAVEILRQKAETHMAAGNPALAREVYEEIIRTYEYPWVRLGVAQSFRLKERFEEAKATLDEVVRDAPDYLGAQDLQAQIVTEEDRQQAARAAVAADKPEEAAKFLGGFDAIQLEGLPPDDRIARVTTGLRAGAKEAEEYFRSERDWIRQAAFKPLVTMDVVGAALKLRDNDLALGHAERLFMTGDMRQIFKAMLGVFVQAGLEDEFRALQRRVALLRATAPRGEPEAVSVQ